MREWGGNGPGGGRPWCLPLAERVLLVAVYYRTNLTMRQLAPLSGVSSATVCRVIQRLRPLLALEQASLPADAVERLWIVDGTLIPVRDRKVGASSRNYRFSANVQIIIDADTRLVVAAARPVPGTTADAKAWRDSGLAQTCRDVTVLGDGAYINTGLVVPHRQRPGRRLLPGEEADNTEHRRVRARVEHTFARMKHYKISSVTAGSAATASTTPSRPLPTCTTLPWPHEKARHQPTPGLPTLNLLQHALVACGARDHALCTPGPGGQSCIARTRTVGARGGQVCSGAGDVAEMEGEAAKQGAKPSDAAPHLCCNGFLNAVRGQRFGEQAARGAHFGEEDVRWVFAVVQGVVLDGGFGEFGDRAAAGRVGQESKVEGFADGRQTSGCSHHHHLIACGCLACLHIDSTVSDLWRRPERLEVIVAAVGSPSCTGRAP
ncbi:hypothetical protein HEK616_83180 (plasmid) [Streptomyces nigrescens]|uniref:Transposase n=1 Tax=Streptomyces nigrescens TaxID=1920 RepID=A0ABN6RD78_STRNI|nr:hypothetical protein HEK616_83180 [Streptomyces nigrescens]